PPVRYSAEQATGGIPAEFFVTHFRKLKPEGEENLRVFWAWSAGEGWQVADNPRVAFVRHAVLYKLYLVRHLNATEDSSREDPCVQFMRVLLPELQKALPGGV